MTTPADATAGASNTTQANSVGSTVTTEIASTNPACGKSCQWDSTLTCFRDQNHGDVHIGGNKTDTTSWIQWVDQPEALPGGI